MYGSLTDWCLKMIDDVWIFVLVYGKFLFWWTIRLTNDFNFSHSCFQNLETTLRKPVREKNFGQTGVEILKVFTA